MQGRFIYLGKSLSINCNYVPYYVGNGLGLKREGFCRGFAPLSIITRQGYFQLNDAPPPRIPRHTTPARFNETWSVLPWLNPCHPFSSSFLPFRVRPPPFLSYYLEKLKLDSHGLTFRFSLLPLANRKIRPATGWKLRTSFLPVTGKQRGKEIFYFGISNDLETRREREREEVENYANSQRRRNFANSSTLEIYTWLIITPTHTTTKEIRCCATPLPPSLRFVNFTTRCVTWLDYFNTEDTWFGNKRDGFVHSWRNVIFTIFPECRESFYREYSRIFHYRQ